MWNFVIISVVVDLSLFRKASEWNAAKRADEKQIQEEWKQNTVEKLRGCLLKAGEK